MNDERAFSRNGNILIVDDKLENLKVLESTLTEYGYTVRKAINGSMECGLNKIQKLRRQW